MEIKVLSNKPVHTILCGSDIFKAFKKEDFRKLVPSKMVTRETRILKDRWMKPKDFIGMDSSGEWIFSSIN